MPQNMDFFIEMNLIFRNESVELVIPKESVSNQNRCFQHDKEIQNHLFGIKLVKLHIYQQDFLDNLYESAYFCTSIF